MGGGGGGATPGAGAGDGGGGGAAIGAGAAGAAPPGSSVTVTARAFFTLGGGRGAQPTYSSLVLKLTVLGYQVRPGTQIQRPWLLNVQLP